MPDTVRNVVTDSGGKLRYEGWKDDGWKPTRGHLPITHDPENYAAGTLYTVKQRQGDRTVTFTAVPCLEVEGKLVLDLDAAEMATWTP